MNQPQIAKRMEPKYSRRLRQQGLQPKRRGASHVLTVIAQIPILILIVAMAVELNSMMLTQTGLQYSAAATARAAIVWLPAEGTIEDRLEQIRIAANSSFSPYCSGDSQHVAAVRQDAYSAEMAEAFHQSFASFVGNSADNQLLRNKMRYARDAMKIEIDVYHDFDPLEQKRVLKSPSGHVIVRYLGRQRNRAIDKDNPDIDVRLTFEKPIDVPGVGVMLGEPASWSSAKFYSKQFQAKASMTIEGVKSTNHRLGVKYDVFDN